MFRNVIKLLFIFFQKHNNLLMEILNFFIDLILHLDKHLFELILNYGIWIYAILFLIIFVETGLVVFPFLPGDSLLFAAGTFCAGFTNETGQTAELNLSLVLLLLTIAAILGDSTNYYIGNKIGNTLLKVKIKNKPIIKSTYIDKTHDFFETYGPKTIIIARFVPIVRTFAPFVAGLSSMTYKTFFRFNIIGGVVWVFSLIFLGYFFGNLEFVKKNFETVIFGIIGISILPMIIEFVKHKINKTN